MASSRWRARQHRDGIGVQRRLAARRGEPPRPGRPAAPAYSPWKRPTEVDHMPRRRLALRHVQRHLRAESVKVSARLAPIRPDQAHRPRPIRRASPRAVERRGIRLAPWRPRAGGLVHLVWYERLEGLAHRAALRRVGEGQLLGRPDRPAAGHEDGGRATRRGRGRRGCNRRRRSTGTCPPSARARVPVRLAPNVCGMPPAPKSSGWRVPGPRPTSGRRALCFENSLLPPPKSRSTPAATSDATKALHACAPTSVAPSPRARQPPRDADDHGGPGPGSS